MHRLSGVITGPRDGGLVGHDVHHGGACRLVAGGQSAAVAFAGQALGAVAQGPERIGAPLGVGAAIVGTHGGGQRVEARIEHPAVHHAQETADLADTVAAVPDLDPAVVALLGAPPLGVAVMAGHDAIHPTDQLASAQRRPARHRQDNSASTAASRAGSVISSVRDTMAPNMR